MTNTAHYMSRHSKHRLNTDVLNENTTMKWENTSMKAISGTLCYYTLTPVVKYNCIMFLLKYKTTHKYTVTTKIFLYFFQKCCSLYIIANTNECVNDLHRTNTRIYNVYRVV